MIVLDLISFQLSNKKQIEKQGLKPLTQPIIRKQIDFEVNCKIPLGDNIRHSVSESFPYMYLKYIIDISNKTALFLSDVKYIQYILI